MGGTERSEEWEVGEEIKGRHGRDRMCRVGQTGGMLSYPYCRSVSEFNGNQM